MNRDGWALPAIPVYCGCYDFLNLPCHEEEEEERPAEFEMALRATIA